MSSSSDRDGNIVFPITVFENKTFTDGSFKITMKFPPEISQLAEEEKNVIFKEIEEAIKRPEFRQAMYEQNGRPFQIVISYSVEFDEELRSQGWKRVDFDDTQDLEGTDDE